MFHVSDHAPVYAEHEPAVEEDSIRGHQDARAAPHPPSPRVGHTTDTGAVFLFHTSIFTFNVHFDKENDCIQNLTNAMPYHQHRYFITFYFINFLLLTNNKLDLPYEVDSHKFPQVYSALHGFASFTIVFKIASTQPE